MDNVVARIKNQEAIWKWHPLKLTSPDLQGYELEVFTMCDAMKLKCSDKLVRFMVTAKEQQQIADCIKGIFHTSKTADERHKQADVLLPAVVQVPPKSGNITALSTEAAYSQCIDDLLCKVSNLNSSSLISTVGKPWVLTRNTEKQQKWGINTAYNYGWHDKNAIYKSNNGDPIWQPVVSGMSPLVHNDCHKDPSQVCEMLHRDANLKLPSGEIVTVDLRNIYTDENLWKLVSYEGPLKYTRQQGIIEETPNSYISPNIYD